MSVAPAVAVPVAVADDDALAVAVSEFAAVAEEDAEDVLDDVEDFDDDWLGVYVGERLEDEDAVPPSEAAADGVS